MQIVIDIPEEYKVLFDTERCSSKFDSLATNEFGYVLRKAFESSTSLPKRHGRLIDVDKIVYETECEYMSDGCCTTKRVPSINATPTVIEANTRQVNKVTDRLRDNLYSDGLINPFDITSKNKSKSEDKNADSN